MERIVQTGPGIKLNPLMPCSQVKTVLPSQRSLHTQAFLPSYGASAVEGREFGVKRRNKIAVR